MKIIVGLGNPEEKYKNTRHNVGYLVLDKIQNEISNFKFLIPAWAGKSKQFPNPKFQTEKKFNSEILYTKDILFIKPQTYMNASGEAVSAVANFYKIPPQDIWVIHDDLDIRLGEYKIQQGTGPKLHYGIASIEEKLGSKDFWRVRIGVDNRDPENRIPGEAYVLKDFLTEEIEVVKKVIENIVRELSSRLI